MDHTPFMREAIDLAAKGFPAAFPNPLVGCVIVQGQKVVSTGYHQKYGSHHAEVNAIKALSEKINPADCTLYVTLEPCNHFGKTPPCTDLIISKGFKNVVIGAADPNAVARGGAEKLRSVGINVISGVMQEEIIKQNRRFFIFHQKKRPYIILKWAQTADGFISRWPVPEKRKDNWISGKEANKAVHKLRASTMAVMVGKNTVLSDNPKLTVRHVKGENPLRLVVDKNLEIPKNKYVYDLTAPTIIINALHEEKKEGNLDYIKVDFSSNFLANLWDKLFELGIQSVLVEGGAILLDSIIHKGYWDEIQVFHNPVLHFASGIKAPEIGMRNEPKPIGNDLFYQFYNDL